MLDHRAHPYLFEHIVSLCPHVSLLALRTASRDICAFIDARLAKHLVLVPWIEVVAPTGRHPAIRLENGLDALSTFSRVHLIEALAHVKVIDWLHCDPAIDRWLWEARQLQSVPIVRLWLARKAYHQMKAPVLEFKTLVIFGWKPPTARLDSRTNMLVRKGEADPPLFISSSTEFETTMVIHVDIFCPYMPPIDGLGKFDVVVVVFHRWRSEEPKFDWARSLLKYIRKMLRWSAWRGRQLMFVNLDAVPDVIMRTQLSDGPPRFYPFVDWGELFNDHLRHMRKVSQGTAFSVPLDDERDVTESRNREGYVQYHSWYALPFMMTFEEYRSTLRDDQAYALQMDENITLASEVLNGGQFEYHEQSERLVVKHSVL